MFLKYGDYDPQMIIGLVGKPSVGKSTFFKAATLAEVAIAAYPFTTLTPNEGVAFVKIDCVDKEFGKQCNPRFGFCLKGKRFVPVQLIDVPGLVPGAHEGKGLGNQFLENLRQADILIHVIDISGSANEKGEILSPGEYDPANDVRFLEEELDNWYYGVMMKGWERFAKQVEVEKKKLGREIAKQMNAFKVTEELVEEAMEKLRLDAGDPSHWPEGALFSLASMLRQLTKPMIIACNKVDVKTGKENLIRLRKEFPHYLLIACSAESEVVLRSAAKNNLVEYAPGDTDFKILHPEKLSEKQKAALEFVRQNILIPFGGTGVQETLDKAVFDFLKYIAIFPGGVSKLEDREGRVLPDCFLMPEKSTALDFAYKLHTDLGDHFIRAIDVKTKRTVGREHLLKHRDVMEIVSGK